MAFTKAVKTKSKLRLAIFGPSGGGKTYTALRIAKGMTAPEKIALIDTEHGSASKYSDRFSFDTDDLSNPTIDNLIRKLEEAANGGYEVVIIDSLSHAWQELLDEMDRLAKAKCSGNSFAAWRDGTPKQRRLITAILDYPGHIIATMRVKTEWIIEQNERGKATPRRKGLSPEQGKGIEYEFDMLMEIGEEHIANIIKDRTGKYQDAIIDKPGEDFGKDLMAWLTNGVEPPKPIVPPQAEPGADGFVDDIPANDPGLDAVFGPPSESVLAELAKDKTARGFVKYARVRYDADLSAQAKTVIDRLLASPLTTDEVFNRAYNKAQEALAAKGIAI